jgi:hypothetical protein
MAGQQESQKQTRQIREVLSPGASGCGAQPNFRLPIMEGEDMSAINALLTKIREQGKQGGNK